MGRQVYFHMHPDDIAEFEQMLKAQRGVCFIAYRSSESWIKILPALSMPTANKSEHMVYLARETDLTNIEIRSVPALESWTPDLERSPVVEFGRSYYNDNIIRRERLYFQPGYYDSYEPDAKWIEKPQDFVKWADGLLRWIRRHYKRNPHTNTYVGPHAWEWLSQGGHHKLIS